MDGHARGMNAKGASRCLANELFGSSDTIVTPDTVDGSEILFQLIWRISYNLYQGFIHPSYFNKTSYCIQLAISEVKLDVFQLDMTLLYFNLQLFLSALYCFFLMFFSSGKDECVVFFFPADDLRPQKQKRSAESVLTITLLRSKQFTRSTPPEN